MDNLAWLDTWADDSRIWFYIAQRRLTPAEVSNVEEALTAFIPTWQAHGKALEGHFAILDHGMVLLAVKQGSGFNPVTGCSIDSSVAVMRKLEQELGISFRGIHGAIQNIGGDLRYVPKEQWSAWTGEEQVLNTTVSTLGEWKKQPFKTASQAGLLRMAQMPFSL